MVLFLNAIIIRNPNNPNGGQWLLKYVVSLLNNLPPLLITAPAFQNFKLTNATSCRNINPIPTSDFTSIIGQIICCWWPCQYNYCNEIFLLTHQKTLTLISMLPPDHPFIWFPCRHPLPNLTTTCTWGCHTVVPPRCTWGCHTGSSLILHLLLPHLPFSSFFYRCGVTLSQHSTTIWKVEDDNEPWEEKRFRQQHQKL